MNDRGQRGGSENREAPVTTPPGAVSGEVAKAQVEPDYPMTISKAGGSWTRLLLLLLVLVAAGGIYLYFMAGEPVSPSASPPAVVRVPVPRLAPVPALSGQTLGAVPPPVSTPSTPVPAKPVPLTESVTIAPPSHPAPPAPALPAAVPVAVSAGPVTPTAHTKAALPPAVVAAAGPWQVEAGTFQSEAALKAAVTKLRTLGFAPQVNTEHTTVAMTRLRIGTYPAGKLHEALALVRATAPEAFALRSGEGFTVYAGTYVSPRNVRWETGRLTGAGFQVEAESVLVPRPISRIRCSGFADEAAAAAAAAEIRAAGINAVVVKPH